MPAFGQVSHSTSHSTLGQLTLSLLHAGKKLLQHDGALSEVDPEISSLIQKEKNRQVGAAG